MPRQARPYEGTEGENFKDEDIREEDSESFIKSNFSSFNEQQQGPNPKQILQNYMNLSFIP